ncbi:MAG: hypothetical protein OER95_00780 [Acidimicrobiia bacterium]|nr:hypothetical protein [Acidimicrobiia bacterium]
MLVLTLGLGLAGTGALATAAAGESSPVPFKASVSGTVTATGASTFRLDASGLASHLGRLDAYIGEGTITSIDPETGVITDVLIETFTAANGDTLTIRCDQVLEPMGNGLLEGTDTWTVIGGTGRFEDATGSGTGTTAVVDLATFTKELKGMIMLAN